MSVQGPFKIDCGPHGLGVISEVSSLDDFDKSTKDNRVRARDKDTGLPLWQVEVLDFDPQAREKTYRVFGYAATDAMVDHETPGNEIDKRAPPDRLDAGCADCRRAPLLPHLQHGSALDRAERRLWAPCSEPA